MPLVVPNAGELVLLNQMLRLSLSTQDTHVLKLYNNNYSPVAASTTANFTPTTFVGYAPKTLTRAGWAAPATVGLNAECSYTTIQSWTCGSVGDTVYGYYVTRGSNDSIMWAEIFTTPRALGQGDILNITPKFTLSSENNN